MGCGGGGGATNGCLSLPGSNPSGALAVFLSDVVNLNSYFRICLIYTAKESRKLLSSFLFPTTNIVCIGNSKVIVPQKKESYKRFF